MVECLEFKSSGTAAFCATALPSASVHSLLISSSHLHHFYCCVHMVCTTSRYAAVSWAFFSERIPHEEALLAQFYPEDYPPYVARTWIGIPFISNKQRRAAVAAAAQAQLQANNSGHSSNCNSSSSGSGSGSGGSRALSPRAAATAERSKAR
jgi:hypothetical protein